MTNAAMESLVTHDVAVGSAPATRRCVWWFCFLSVLLGLPSATQSLVRADQVQPSEPFVLGYTDQLSYVAGDQIGFHLSSSHSTVDVTIDRLGAERTPVWQRQAIAVAQHSIPDRASSDGCKWPQALKIQVSPEWQSGYYEVSLTGSNEAGAASGDPSESRDASETSDALGAGVAKSTLFFIVRNASPGNRTRILLQLSTNTYNAYTNWGGHSLYSYHDRDGLQGHRVSFDRPIQSQFNKWELPFVQWAEKSGYVIDFAANSDLELRPEILQSYRLVLSVGHDEYWSSEMRDHLESFITSGGNVAFFSGNTCCWQVRSEDDGRALTCWKQSFNLDPLYRRGDPRLLSTAWSHHLVGRPENELTGVGFLWGGYHRSHGQFMDGPASYKVHRPDHWLFSGTELQREQRFGGKHTIVGYECDGCELEWRDGLPFPTHKDGTPDGFTVLATCPARWAPDDCYWYDRFPKDRTGNAVLGTYTRGGTVVTVGSTDWAHGLAGLDASVVQITRNVLDRLGSE
ncbi:MAG: N,N-dimethylformamidase beta subunit family domain-containing protein [Rubripirellula sp.]